MAWKGCIDLSGLIIHVFNRSTSFILLYCLYRALFFLSSLYTPHTLPSTLTIVAITVYICQGFALSGMTLMALIV